LLWLWPRRMLARSWGLLLLLLLLLPRCTERPLLLLLLLRRVATHPRCHRIPPGRHLAKVSGS